MSNGKSNKINFKIPYWISYGSLGVFLILLGSFLIFFFKSTSSDIVHSKTITQASNGLIRLDLQSSRFILRTGIPMLEKTSGEDDLFRFSHMNWADLYWKLSANINQTTSKEILKAQIPLLTFVKPTASLPQAKIIQPIIKPDIPELKEKLPEIPFSSQEPTVLIYHTHTSESYIPESGKAHLNNSKGDIVKVGAHLKKVLEETYGIKTIHCDTIHDTYPFRESYQRSQVTLKKYLNDNPSLQIALDIHRDATPGVNATCIIEGKKTTNVLIVVGTDKMGLSHPNWRQNHSFASELSQAMNYYYPGLSSGIIVSKARYNQHLNEGALILEFGDHQSKLQEAYNAAELFAEVLANKIKQGLLNKE